MAIVYCCLCFSIMCFSSLLMSCNCPLTCIDLVDASGGKPEVVNHAVEVEKVIELPSNEFDNEPLSKWIEEMHMSSAIDGSSKFTRLLVPSFSEFCLLMLRCFAELLPVDSAVQCTVNGDNQGNGVVLGVISEKQPESESQSYGLGDRGDIAPTEPQSLPSVNSTVAVVLDKSTEKQSKRGTQTASLVDKVSTAASEPQLSSVEEMTMVVLLNQDGEKQSENEAWATAMVDRSSLIPIQPQSSVEKTLDIVLHQDNEKQPEYGTTLAPVSVDNVEIVLSEPENLPFVKNTILWKTIESMEVFQKMPQKPHFQPLENFKESSREGVAIGYMVTFSSLVERTSKLQINDPISTMFDIKESLVELEKHGFDVMAVEDSINKLLAMKNVEEKLVHDVSTLDDQITEHSHEITRIESDIEEINEHISVLQKKLSLAKSAKEKEDEEIAFLLVRRRETKDTIENVKNDFNGIVSSIL